ncbi:hypothetical protein D915_010492 [Fasciola hepatica]|uniref:EF-hand domain-containing protein n=1 Tax=Fasciola hepatica TaxID=6192 RepID=A0A4E0RPW3_FASHE|nr:hypothetical protein D915_010492 [Fasciola hepatica]
MEPMPVGVKYQTKRSQTVDAQDSSMEVGNSENPPKASCETRTEMKMAVDDQQLTANTEEEMLEAFALYDKDGDGLLTAEDVLRMFDSLGLGFTKEDIEIGISRLARDGRKFITPAEFVSLVGQTISGPEISHILNGIFQSLDRSGDGQIDSKELASRLSATVEPTTEQAAKQLMELMDTDGDARVNREEFSHILTSGFTHQ